VTRLRQDGFARHAFLEQQFRGLHARLGMKAPDEHIVADHIRQRDERHALVVGEERPDDDRTRATRLGGLLQVGFERPAVERLVVPEPSR
jgi:hypothetical protein